MSSGRSPFDDDEPFSLARPFRPELSGPRRPLPSTPPLGVGWVRRTTTIDVRRDDLYGPGTLDMRGRDVVVNSTGEHVVIASARLDGDVSSDSVITRLDVVDGTDPPTGDAVAGMVGVATNNRFRAAVHEHLADEAARCSLWHLLVDDLVGAVLVSGVAAQNVEARTGGGPIEELTRAHGDLMVTAMSDLCAGWAADATMLTLWSRDERLPVACGPLAPDVAADQPQGWHDVAALGRHDVRRRRSLDVGPAGDAETGPFVAHFRDSHVGIDGVERSVHEYLVTGTVDWHGHGGTLSTIEAAALVLPWQECPGAIGRERDLVGTKVADLRSTVRSDFKGIATCTHLNDTLRSLGDLDALAVIGQARTR